MPRQQQTHSNTTYAQHIAGHMSGHVAAKVAGQSMSEASRHKWRHIAQHMRRCWSPSADLVWRTVRGREPAPRALCLWGGADSKVPSMRGLLVGSSAGPRGAGRGRGGVPWRGSWGSALPGSWPSTPASNSSELPRGRRRGSPWRAREGLSASASALERSLSSARGGKGYAGYI